MDAVTLPELITADDPRAAECVEGGVDHDFRTYAYETARGRRRESLRCVWCHVVACGDVTEPDPCMQPYHHRGDHVSRFGVRWPLGGNRPDTGRP